MGLFSFFKKEQHFFSASEEEEILAEIKTAEQKTSGEIRLYVESRCRYVDPLDRASEIFWSLKMDQTIDHNAVLVYVALKDHQYAIYADKGIHQIVGTEFWQKEVNMMKRHFRENHPAQALVEVIHDIGEALIAHYPYERKMDKNELPDEIIFGR